MRIILDTNVLISAALSTSSVPAKVLDHVLDNHIALASQESHAELEDVIWRKKLDPLMTPDERYLFLSVYYSESQLIDINEKITVCRDPKDNMLLELAVAGKADFIITGDQDLLELNPFRNIRIVKPNEFLDALRKK